MIPTVGFNMRKVTKGNVTIKVFVKYLSCDCHFAQLHVAVGHWWTAEI